MSTKSTIAYGPNFHFYHEVLDEDYVYLQLEGVQFEAAYNHVMVPIPIHIWEVIRQYPGIELDYVDKTDEEIRLYVERQVDDRIKRLNDAGEKGGQLVRFAGSLIYGMADKLREEQIAAGVEYFTRTRKHQKEIKQAIVQLEQANRSA